MCLWKCTRGWFWIVCEIYPDAGKAAEKRGDGWEEGSLTKLPAAEFWNWHSWTLSHTRLQPQIPNYHKLHPWPKRATKLQPAAWNLVSRCWLTFNREVPNTIFRFRLIPIGPPSGWRAFRLCPSLTLHINPFWPKRKKEKANLSSCRISPLIPRS